MLLQRSGAAPRLAFRHLGAPVLVVSALAATAGFVLRAQTAPWESCYTHETLPLFITNVQRLAAVQTLPLGARGGAALAPADMAAAMQRVQQQMTIPNSVNFHDCQGLVDGNEHKAVVAIYAIQEGLLLTDADFANNRGTAFRVAIFHKLSPGKSHGETRIGSELEFGCIFVGIRNVIQSRLPAVRDTSEGRLVLGGGFAFTNTPYWADHGPCNQASMPIPTSQRFGVIRWRPADRSIANLPVVRWHWNEHSRRHAYGVKCGDGWCAIGRGVQRFAAHPCGNVFPGAMDVQPLGEMRDGRLRVRPGAAFFCPDPGLGGLASEAQFSTFQPVASVHIGGFVGGYKGLFATGSQTGTMANRILLKHDPTLDTDPAKGWLMRVVRPSGSWDVRIMHRQVVAGRPAQTVRWRWLPYDEGNWIWCAGGCCEDVPPPPGP